MEERIKGIENMIEEMNTFIKVNPKTKKHPGTNIQ